MKRLSLAVTFLVAAMLRPALAVGAPRMPAPAVARAYTFSSPEIDQVMRPIALYPDPLLNEVLAAAAHPSEIPAAAQWAESHRSLTAVQIERAVVAAHSTWDASVRALLPFPTLLHTMASDMTRTRELGGAVTAQRDDVMAAVQRLRREAMAYGYLRSNADVRVTHGAEIKILPVDPQVMPVPYYDSFLVFSPPQRGADIARAVDYDQGVRIGT